MKEGAETMQTKLQAKAEQLKGHMEQKGRWLDFRYFLKRKRSNYLLLYKYLVIFNYIWGENRQF